MATRSPALQRLTMLVSVLVLAMPAAAQTPDEPPVQAPAHIAYLDGSGTLERDGRAEVATINTPLVAGDRLRTEKGRAEVIYGDGSVLDIDHFSSVDFLSDDLVRLLEGRVGLTINGRDRVSYRIDTPSGAVRIEWPGEYRVALIGSGGARDVELVVIRGEALLVNDLGETEVRAGERALASAGLAPSYAQAYNSARPEAFDEWVEWRRGQRTGTTSARYLPDEIHGYAGDFDRYGEWRHDHDYGFVWYPRVHVGWRPYYYGHWSWFGPWGWTWISYDRWGWPTHHYGRWGFRAGVWFWIPRRHWGPAWVYWASAPGYVGWCPLGWNNRPIFSIVNVNIVNLRRGFGPHHVWTVVPRRTFGVHGDLSRHAVPRDRLRVAVPRWNVESTSAPIRPAVQRNVTPIYTAGRAFARTRNVTVEQLGAGTGGRVTTLSPNERDRGAARAVRRSGPEATGSGVQRRTIPATPGSLDRGTSGSERTIRRSGPEQAPRRTAPSGPGTLDRGNAGTSGRVNRAVPRYRDAGPGGSDAAPDTARTSAAGRAPDSGERRMSEPARTPIPRSSAPSRRRTGDWGFYSPPSRSYRAPERRAPDNDAVTGRGGYRSGGGMRSAPERRDSPPSVGRSPGSGRAPSAGPSGGSRAPSRAVPRSGGSASAGSRSGSRSGSGSGDRSRARPRPRPQ